MRSNDWLQEAAIHTTDERDVIYTSILACAELLVLLHEHETVKYKTGAPRAITNMFEPVPIVPKEHKDAVLVAAAFLGEYELTPFDAVHTEPVTSSEERTLSTEQDYDAVGSDRACLESASLK